MSTTVFGQEPVFVENEPFHKPVYEDEFFVVISLQMEKGDTSLFHIHRRPILYITLRGAQMWLNEQNKKERLVFLPDGWMGSDSYSGDDPFIHQISVADQGPLQLLAIIRKKSSADSVHTSGQPIYDENGFTVVADSAAYAPNHEKLNIILHGSAKAGNRELNRGDFFFAHQRVYGYSENFRYCRVYF